MTVATTQADDAAAVPKPGHWLHRIDGACERIGDSLNPILIKETRQALKSRQFVTTFSVLLFAALAWTVVGSLSLMPQIYTSPSAPRLLIGYYIVLAIPMLLVVPLAAYRSLEGEIDDGTLELLSISTLSPWQIVLGKLASAMLQMVLYYVALFPCVAYAYTLRGVDLPTTLLIMALLIAAAVVLTILSLFFAPLARSRTGRISTLLAVMLVLLLSEWGLAYLVVNLILFGNPLSAGMMFYIVTAVLMFALSLGHLLLTATAAQLTPASENRSTHLRVSMLLFSSVIVGLGALAIQMFDRDASSFLLIYSMVGGGFWLICGSMIAAEREVMTPRVRRELPSSLFARCLLTWLTPGPVTGLVFAVVNLVALTGAGYIAFRYLFDLTGMPAAGNRVNPLIIGFTSYAVVLLVGVRLVIGVIRIKNDPRVELGLAALIALAVLSALVPYSVGLHFNDYREYSYSGWQISNWAWTLSEIYDQGRNMDREVLVVTFTGLVSFLGCILATPQAVLARRTATPLRVTRERTKARSQRL
ncbi:MAG: ABC transporter permease [Rubripirellula sp.]|nr:ABC transporter permease [Rubripirellula sp.]